MGTSRNVLEVIRGIYNVDQLLSGKEYIRELIHRLAKALNVKYVMVGHAIKPQENIVQTDYFYADGKIVDNITYDLEGTPCSDVLCGTRVGCYGEKVQQLFPRDKMLKDINAQSYMGSPFFSPEGELLGLLVVMNDQPFKELELMTSVVEFFAARIGAEYRRLDVEETLKQHNEDLEKLVQERTMQLISQEKLATIGRITLGIAHELKNPLNIIINASELLMSSEIDSESRRRALDMIYQYGVRANDIITSMLKQARQDENMQPERIDISTLLSHALDVFLRSRNDINLKSKLRKSIHITPQVEVDLIDSPGVERVFINIIDNAVYALSEKLQRSNGSFVPELRVDLHVERGRCQVRIRDNGTGIPQNHLLHVCDEFYTTKPPGEGTGLGLWVAKQMVEKNRGTFDILSKENEYTEVIIEFPEVFLLAEPEATL